MTTDPAPADAVTEGMVAAACKTALWNYDDDHERGLMVCVLKAALRARAGAQ